MRVGFVYNDELNTVGYTRNIDVTPTLTFGYIIDLVCKVFGWQEDDRVFMRNSFTVARRHWAPVDMGFSKRENLLCAEDVALAVVPLR